MEKEKDYRSAARQKLDEAGFKGITDPVLIASLVPLLEQAI